MASPMQSSSCSSPSSCAPPVSSSKPSSLHCGRARGGLLFVGFVPKSSRTRRRLGVCSSTPPLRGASSRFLSVNASLSTSAKALVDLERKCADGVESGGQDGKAQVAHLEDIIEERGACGVGFIANLDNKASHQIVEVALSAHGCMEHRGGCGADNDSSDGSGVNREIVKIQRVTAPGGQMQLKSLIEAHVEKTGSGKGSEILKEWDKYLPLFWQLVPPSEEDTPEDSALYERNTAGQSALHSA